MSGQISSGILSIVRTALVNALGSDPTVIMLASGPKLICGCIIDGPGFLPFTVDVKKRHAVVYRDQLESTLRYGATNALSIEEYITEGSIQDPHKDA